MASLQERFQGLLSGSNTLGNLGLGLLAASGPSAQPRSIGQVLASGTQFASQRQQEAMRNQAMRDALAQRKKQQAAQIQLQGLLGSGQPIDQQQVMGLLSQANPDAFGSALTTGLLGQMFAQPSGLQEKINTVASNLGRDLTDTEVLKMAGGGTTINVGGESKLDEPIPISSVSDVRLPNGKSVPIGTTFRQAREMGAQVMSGEEQKRSTQADAALGILAELEQIALGPNGLFASVDPGLANRFGAALQFGLDTLTQNDPRASQFQDLTKSTIAPFVRFLGESGALATEDVNRALGLLPQIFPLPDTKEVAAEKLSIVREIIERGVRKMNSPSEITFLGFE